MDSQDAQDVVDHINDEIRRIVLSQIVLADIHEKLRQRDLRPLEEDFIDADFHETEVGEPTVRDFGDVRIVVRKLHRRGVGARDIRGADLLYEIEGEKFVLIQYKTPNIQSRIGKEAEQLDTLVQSCSNPCPPPGNCRFCGCWHCVRSTDSFYHPACVADVIFGDADSRHEREFSKGLSKEQFDLGFAECWIGARVSAADIAYLTATLLEASHLIAAVKQIGRF